MAKKNKTTPKKGGPGINAYYYVAAGVAIVGLVVYSVFVPVPSDEAPASEEAPTPRPEAAPTDASGEVEIPVEILEQQVRKMAEGLREAGGRGDSPIFASIANMAKNAEDVLKRAAAASSEKEKRKILQSGLEARADMLSSLTNAAQGLHEAQEAEEQENKPLTMQSAHVAALTTETFPEFMVSNPLTMVEFFAPWCGHCKKLAPEYEKAAELMDGQAGFAVVDATQEQKLARIFGVQGYPTLKWFYRGREITDYNGPRTADGIASWVKTRLEPAFTNVDLDDDTDLTQAIEASGDSSLTIFAGKGSKDTELYTTFEVVAHKFRGRCVFLWAKGTGETSVALYRHGEDPETCHGDSCESVEGLVSWLEVLLPTKAAA